MSTRLERYLAELPGGLQAHPACQQKGSILRSALAQLPGVRLPEAVPGPVRALWEEPPLASAWVPEVHTTALALALCDEHFGDEQAYLAHALEMNRALLRSPLYRALMVVASPPLLLRHVGTRWEALHRGSSLAGELLEPGRARVVLRYPEHLFAELVVRSFGTALQAACEGSGGQEVACAVAACGPTEAEYRVSWR